MNDLISRRAVIDLLLSEPPEPRYPDWWVRKVMEIEPKTGKWVIVNEWLSLYMCDHCGEILQIDSVPIWDYCPVCGAKMEVKHE